MCEVRDVTELLARDAALLRTRSGRAATISATDAVVAAFAFGAVDPIVLTSAPDDLRRSSPTRRRPSSSLACSDLPRYAESEAGEAGRPGIGGVQRAHVDCVAR